jgi:hypothetical protein
MSEYENQFPARWAQGGGGGNSRRVYIEGELIEPLSMDGSATIDLTYPFGDETTAVVLGNWFSAETGDRIGAIWFKDDESWVAIMKRCPVDETGDDPEDGDGGTPEDGTGDGDEDGGTPSDPDGDLDGGAP